MPRAPRIPRAQVIALPRPANAEAGEWIVAALALSVLVAGLLGL